MQCVCHSYVQPLDCQHNACVPSQSLQLDLFSPAKKIISFIKNPFPSKLREMFSVVLSYSKGLLDIKHLRLVYTLHT